MVTPAELAVAYALDLAAGDPEWFPHPVRFFGALIRRGERLLLRFRGTPARDLACGGALTVAVAATAWLAGMPSAPLARMLLAWTTLATRSLLVETNAVVTALEAGDAPRARRQLARIVGRDTEHLDESEIARAAIETLAESTCDGIVAPLFWLAIGGLPAAMAYKAVNTLDSMIGHPEPPYRYFGRIAARLDDLANLVPSRLTALGIAAAGASTQALAMWWREGDLHASPNSGQSEAAMAGALDVRLGGTNFYDGVRHDGPQINVQGQLPSIPHVRHAMRLVATVSILAFGAALLVLEWRRR